MTDWPLDKPTNDDTPSNTFTTHPTRHNNMSKKHATPAQIHEEIQKFEKTMQELQLLKNISQDLKNYRKMIRIKKHD